MVTNNVANQSRGFDWDASRCAMEDATPSGPIMPPLETAIAEVPRDLHPHRLSSTPSPTYRSFTVRPQSPLYLESATTFISGVSGCYFRFDCHGRNDIGEAPAGCH